MSNDDVPDFRLLPSDPAAFFGLDTGFDRSELRRSYARLIKRFKPETHPAEFQKIRAAYELLDARLRYGLVSDVTHPTACSEAYGDATTWKSSLERGEPDAARRTGSLSEFLKLEPVESLYKRLSAIEEKSPCDYYALALLSDAVAGEHVSFLTWVLDGIRQHPFDLPLLSLLQTYVREDLPDEAIESTLTELGGVIGDDRYYFITEPLWNRLLRRESFEEFSRAWQTCQSKVRDHRIAARVAFLIHVLRPAMWTADDAWLAEATAFINGNSDQIGRLLGFDWDLICLLHEYREFSNEFAARHPLCARMDQAIRDYCLLDETDGLRSVVDFQFAVLRDVQGTLDAFPTPSQMSGVVRLGLSV